MPRQLNAPPKKIAQGTEVVCPKCKQVMLIANRDILSGDTVNAEAFDQIGFKGGNGCAMECPHDQTPFGRGGSACQVYVRGYEGWV